MLHCDRGLSQGWGAGMLLERLDGRSPAKVVGAKNFHDIGYLRDLLFNVFTALDVGQRRMGALRPGGRWGCMGAGVGTTSAGVACSSTLVERGRRRQGSPAAVPGTV